MLSQEHEQVPKCKCTPMWSYLIETNRLADEKYLNILHSLAMRHLTNFCDVFVAFEFVFASGKKKARKECYLFEAKPRLACYKWLIKLSVKKKFVWELLTLLTRFWASSLAYWKTKRKEKNYSCQMLRFRHKSSLTVPEVDAQICVRPITSLFASYFAWLQAP